MIEYAHIHHVSLAVRDLEIAKVLLGVTGHAGD